MDSSYGDFSVRHPVPEDAQNVLALMIACETAEHGEHDVDLEDLLDQWTDLDLSQDAWLVTAPDGRFAAYGAVYRGAQRFTFDVYSRPEYSPHGLTAYLLTRCEARAAAQLMEKPAPPTSATIYLSHANLAGREAVESRGYQLVKYHFGMRIKFVGPPEPPDWPEGITLRTFVPGQDDRMVHAFIQEAFDRPGRTPQPFGDWHDFMIGAHNFNPELWFLAYHGSELVGAALCFTYPQYGWVRQLGVADHWRRRGLGRALLRYVFGVFYRQEFSEVGLGVEAQNEKACQLYEHVGMQRKRQYLEYSLQFK